MSFYNHEKDQFVGVYCRDAVRQLQKYVQAPSPT